MHFANQTLLSPMRSVRPQCCPEIELLIKKLTTGLAVEPSIGGGKLRAFALKHLPIYPFSLDLC
jgi:hypothetical protein